MPEMIQTFIKQPLHNVLRVTVKAFSRKCVFNIMIKPMIKHCNVVKVVSGENKHPKIIIN